MEHPAGPYEPIVIPAATTANFENLGKYPHFGRIAIFYDKLPWSQGAFWGGFPAKHFWDTIAPHGKVRNLKGHEAAIGGLQINNITILAVNCPCSAYIDEISPLVFPIREIEAIRRGGG